MRTPFRILSAVLALALFAPLLRAETVTHKFRVPLQMAAHGFTVRRHVNAPTSGFTACPITYIGINDLNFGPSAYLEFTASIGMNEGADWFQIQDSLTGGLSNAWNLNDSAYPPGSPLISTGWSGSTGANVFFAVPSAREGHVFCVKSNNGIVFPAQSGSLLTMDISDGMGGTNSVNYALINVWASVPYGTFYGDVFQLLDLTAMQTAPAGVANLANPAVVWTAHSGSAVLITLGPAEVGNDFVLHTSSGSLQSLHAVASGPTSAQTALVTGVAGLRESVWLVRSDGVTSPTATISQAGSELNWTNYFPADYVPSWTLAQFRIGPSRAGHSFTVRHTNGPGVPFFQVPFSIPEDSVSNGHVAITDSASQPVDATFFERYVYIDEKKDWTLYDENTSENLDQVTSAGDGPGVWHASVPPGKISLNIPNWRKGHTLVVLQGSYRPVEIDPSYTATTSYLTGTRYSSQGTPQARTYTFQFVPALATGNPAQPFWLVDGNEYFYCGANERSPAEWYGPLEMLSLSLNESRWSHELYLRHFDGTQIRIHRSNLQGGWNLTGSGSVFSSFGIFEGLAWRQPLFGYAVFDLTTGELSAANTPALAAWGTNNTDTDGDGLYDWAEVLLGTVPVLADTDGDGVNDFADKFPLDPTRWAWGADVNDHTPPVLTLSSPAGATLVP